MTTYPSDWKVVALGEVASITTGHRDVNEGCEHGYYPFFTCAKKVYSAETYSFDGEAITVAGNGDVGNLHYVNGKFEAYQRTYVLMNFKEDIRYILQFLDARLMPILSEGKFGSSMPYIVLGQLAGVTIPLPPLPEQKRIAGVLGDMDKLIENLGKRIEKKRQIKKGAMQELLTGKKRLSGFTGEWKGRCMGDVGSFYGGLSGKSAPDFGHGDARYITFLNVLNNVVIDSREVGKVYVADGEKQNAVMKGDLFFNGSSETPEEVAMCAALLEDLPNTYLNSFCCGFRLKSADEDPLYISYYFNSGEGRQLVSTMAQGLTRYNLSKKAFLAAKVTWPPLPEQRAIAAVLSDMDAEIANLERRQAKLKQVKKGMLQDLLTGKVRLKGQGGAT